MGAVPILAILEETEKDDALATQLFANQIKNNENNGSVRKEAASAIGQVAKQGDAEAMQLLAGQLKNGDDWEVRKADLQKAIF